MVVVIRNFHLLAPRKFKIAGDRARTAIERPAIQVHDIGRHLKARDLPPAKKQARGVFFFSPFSIRRAASGRLRR